MRQVNRIAEQLVTTLKIYLNRRTTMYTEFDVDTILDELKNKKELANDYEVQVEEKKDLFERLMNDFQDIGSSLDDGISYLEDIKNAIEKLNETIDESNTEGVEV